MKATELDIGRERRDGVPWRITVRKTADGIGVYNPTRRKFGLVVFMLVWLCGWSAGEWFALSEILRPGTPLAIDLFLLVWATAWTLGGLAVLAVVAWNLVGVEKLFLIEGGGIVVERGFGRLTRRKVYRVDQVGDIGFAHQLGTHRAQGILSGGAVRFFVDGKPQSFGIELDEEETGRVVSLMRDFVERHRPAPAADGEADAQDGASQPVRS
ncbi:hypothetical protein [Aquibium sp. ELW1220]|uniref:hypothetical protein n=1 Tax=Aquibium sp. ELW1220 TaxID=2976766 RepID=UPI0025B1685A|nr:hypothetical protein [Aquibium sp. ELW1220]MDN2580296.1 hypothetical protein [Aquibium sp. ELW1220]